MAQAAGGGSVHYKRNMAQVTQQQTSTGGRRGFGSPQEQHGTGWPSAQEQRLRSGRANKSRWTVRLHQELNRFFLSSIRMCLRSA